MGNKYANILVKATDPQGIARFLNDMERHAYILPPKKGYILVCEEACEMFDMEVMSEITQKLTSRCACPAVGLMNFDDDILWYRVYNQGQLVDEYCDDPATPGNEGNHVDERHAESICQAFGQGGKQKQVAEILSASGEIYFSQSARHMALGKALGWPTDYLQFSYADIAEVMDGRGDSTWSPAAILVEGKYLHQLIGNEHLEPFDLDKEIRRLIRQKRLISAMVLVQQHKGCTLKEAEEYIRMSGASW